MRNLLFAAPWASRAEHIWAGDPLYRILAPKGCYSIQANAWKEARPGDLFVATAAQSRPSAKGFVPIARLRRVPGYRALWMFRPDRAPGSVLEVPAPPDAASGDDASTPLGQRRTIRVKRPTTGPAAAPAPAPAAEGEEQPKEESVTPPEFATDVPPSAFSFNAAPVEKTNPIFPILGLLAVAALGVAIFYLFIGDASIFNGALWPTPR